MDPFAGPRRVQVHLEIELRLGATVPGHPLVPSRKHRLGSARKHNTCPGRRRWPLPRDWLFLVSEWLDRKQFPTAY